MRLHRRRWFSGGAFKALSLVSKAEFLAYSKVYYSFLPPSPAYQPTPRVPSRITPGSISSSSKSMVLRGGDSIFPFPIKMEEQLLAYEQRYPSCCFLSNTALSPPPSLQQQPRSSCTELFPGGSSAELLQHRL